MAKIGPREQQIRELREQRAKAVPVVAPKRLVAATAPTATAAKAETPKPLPAAQPKETVMESTATTAAAAVADAPASAPKKPAKPKAKKPQPKAKAKPAKKSAAKKPAAKSKSKGPDVRAGSKLAKVVALLTRSEGCTTLDVLKATEWPSVSMPQMAKSAGLNLRKEKKPGELTRYYGTAA